MTLEPKTDLIWTPLSLLQAAVANCQVLRMFQSLNIRVGQNKTKISGHSKGTRRHIYKQTYIFWINFSRLFKPYVQIIDHKTKVELTFAASFLIRHWKALEKGIGFQDRSLTLITCRQEGPLNLAVLERSACNNSSKGDILPRLYAY